MSSPNYEIANLCQKLKNIEQKAQKKYLIQKFVHQNQQTVLKQVHLQQSLDSNIISQQLLKDILTIYLDQQIQHELFVQQLLLDHLALLKKRLTNKICQLLQKQKQSALQAKYISNYLNSIKKTLYMLFIILLGSQYWLNGIFWYLSLFGLIVCIILIIIIDLKCQCDCILHLRSCFFSCLKKIKECICCERLQQKIDYRRIANQVT